MKDTVSAGIAGLIFGLGLLLSGMTNPAKVIGFLDLTGLWDPSLAFVMGGAVAVGLVAFRVAQRRCTTLLGTPLQLPHTTAIDTKLLGGSALFGIGWGIAGFCPGPALVSAGAANGKALVFCAAMLAGMAIFAMLTRSRAC